MGDFLANTPVIDWDETTPGFLKGRVFGGKSTIIDAADALTLAYVDVASAGTVNLGAVASDKVRITGTTTITSFGTAAAGVRRKVRFAGALTLTYNATSLIIPTAANITTAADDTLVAESLGGGNWFVSSYQRANGQALAVVGGSTGVTLLASGTASAVATLDLVLTAYTAYRALWFILSGCIPVTDGGALQCRLSTNGGVSYDAAAGSYKYDFHFLDTGTPGHVGSSGNTAIIMNDFIGNGAAEGVDIEIWLYNQISTAIKPKVTWRANAYNANDTVYITHGGGQRNAAQDTDAIRVMFASGNIASVKYAVLGLT